MPKFLFWNLGGKYILPLVRTLAEENDVDILILAEVPDSPTATLEFLNSTSSAFQYSFGNCTRVAFYTRFDSSFLTPLSETDKYSIRRLSLRARKEILIVGVHLPSQLHLEGEDIGEECRFLSREIARVEAAEGHNRTLLAGDLNLNPFDTGVVTATGLHAVMSRQVALRNSRIVQSREYPFFYNPMWSHLGDRDSKVAGTYFYAKSKHKLFFWNTFDQILLRPDLIEEFSHNQVQIITTVGSQSLVTNKGRPNKQLGSDHLPITLELDF